MTKPSGSPLSPGDVAIDATTALIFPSSAPLTPAPGLRDARAVWARVPSPTSAPARTALVFLHGHNNYVTVDARGHSRVPDWAGDDPAARAGASAKPAAPLAYGFDRLANHGVMLVPEDAVLARGPFWAREPAGQYRDPARLGALIEESFRRLTQLPRTEGGGGTYLPAGPAESLRRVFLCGHSGAGLPLEEAAGSDIVLPATGVPADLWLFDCTYWSEVSRFVRFCARWHERGRLAGGRVGASRFVCVYRPGTQTEAIADTLRQEIAGTLGVPAAALVRDHAGRAMDPALRGALTSLGTLFVRTTLPHDDIPTFFVPCLLETAV